jgi:hypothetical protein
MVKEWHFGSNIQARGIKVLIIIIIYITHYLFLVSFKYRLDIIDFIHTPKTAMGDVIITMQTVNKFKSCLTLLYICTIARSITEGKEE